MSKTLSAHVNRVNAELKAAGVTKYGMKKFAIRYLPKIIHHDEKIQGVIYGRYADATGSLTLNAGLLVATDKRVVFLDHKPGYTRVDEVNYQSINGVRISTAIFSAVSLFYGAKEYNLRYVNSNCAAKFVHYVERRRLEASDKKS